MTNNQKQYKWIRVDLETWIELKKRQANALEKDPDIWIGDIVKQALKLKNKK